MRKIVNSTPLLLERVFFTRSVIIATPGHKPKGAMVLKHTPENFINIERDATTPDRYLASMTTKFNMDADPEDPYTIDMECIASFKVDPSISDEEIQKHLAFTSHSVLYGAIRESVLWITGRLAWGPITLGLSVIQPAPQQKTK